jgi:hypothetical protein
MYAQLIFEKCTKTIQWGIVSNKWCFMTGYSHAKAWSWTHFSHDSQYTKTKSNYIKVLNVRANLIKVSQGNQCVYLVDLRLGNKKKKNKTDFIKIKIFVRQRTLSR